MKVCKTCGQLNTNDSDFCCNCGKADFVFQEEVACPKCGAANDKSFAYCINCGNKLNAVVANVENAAADQNVATPVNLKEQLTDVYGASLPAQEMAKCPSCGSDVPISAIFCFKCGASVASLHDHRVVKRKICPHCGKPNGTQARFCSYCFFTLANAETQEMQVVHVSKPLGANTVKQTYLQDGSGKQKVCTGCGALNDADEVFCENCGCKLDAEIQKKYCPNCGAENDADGAFCIKCQWSFDGIFPDIAERWVCEKCQHVNSVANGFCVACGAAKNKGRKN